jgi:hypothetical protein
MCKEKKGGSKRRKKREPRRLASEKQRHKMNIRVCFSAAAKDGKYRVGVNWPSLHHLGRARLDSYFGG